jgi:hypothetical protein
VQGFQLRSQVIPQSKQAHELFAMFNIFFKKVGPVGKLRKIDFEDEGVEEYGVGKIENFTRQQLIYLYSSNYIRKILLTSRLMV